MINKSLTAIVFFCTAAVPVFAHKPIWGSEPGVDANTAIHLIDPNISQVVYRPLSAGKNQVWTTLTAPADFGLFVQIGVPVLEQLKNFRPSLAVIGPGLPEPNLPFKIPPGCGAKLIDTNSVEPRFFHEPFTGTDSWILSSTTVRLPKSGRFYIVAFDPKSKGGKIWIAAGQKEKFGISDFFTFGKTKKRVRAFHEVEIVSGTDPNNTKTKVGT